MWNQSYLYSNSQIFTSVTIINWYSSKYLVAGFNDSKLHKKPSCCMASLVNEDCMCSSMVMI